MLHNNPITVVVNCNLSDEADKVLNEIFKMMQVQDIASAKFVINSIEQKLKALKAENDNVFVTGNVSGKKNSENTTIYYFHNTNGLRRALTFFNFDLSSPAVAVPKLCFGGSKLH